MLASSGVAAPEDRDRFVGTRTLEVVEERDAEGNWKEVADRAGKNPLGYIMYGSASEKGLRLNSP